MQQPNERFNLLLIYIGLTVLLPMLLPIQLIFQLIMNQLVSGVWADLHRKTYELIKLFFVYGISLGAVMMFVSKLRVPMRLQAHYASPRWWLVGCTLVFIMLVVNALALTNMVNITPSDREFLMLIQLLAKIILLIATVRVLIGVLPRKQLGSLNK